MTMKEMVKNNILMAMKLHMDSTLLDILGTVITNAFQRVEIVEVETLPATVDDSNKYIIELFKIQKAPKLSEKTVEYYISTINQLIDAVQKPLIKMSQMDIEFYLNTMMKKGNSATSLNNRKRNICSFFSWMRKIHLIVDNPCDGIENYKQEVKPVDHLDSEQFEKLKEGCQDKRDRAVLEVFRSTAMRVGELKNAKISDVDFRTGEYLGHKDNSVAGVHYVAMDKEHTYDIFRRYVAAI